MATPTSTRATTTNINVKLTPNHRLTADSDNFVILTRKIIDPTKGPGYDPAKSKSHEIREEWKDPKYFSLTSAGLTSAIDYVRIKTVASSGVTDLGELVTLIQSETAALVDAINNAIKLPRITVEIDA